MSNGFASALRVFARIGCLSFGGPAGQIAMMHRIFVDEEKWIGEKDFLAALNFCMLLPGPEAMQLATYVGWKRHNVKGGLAAGLLFVLPGAAVVLALSTIYAAFGAIPWIAAVFYGVKAAVLAIVLEALLRVARRALKAKTDWIIAAVAFLALYVFGVPFPLIIIAAALFGFVTSTSKGNDVPPPLPSFRAFVGTAAKWTGVWLMPLAGLALVLGPQHLLTDIALYFSRLAIVTFGGAYAVLSDMAQAAVEQKHWLSAHEMVDGLGLAETTPGPLILVTEFVGYLAAFRQSGMWAGLAAAAITLWMTFVPSFLFIFSGAPYIESINARPRLKGALAAITAAVVGVILNLSLWFSLNVLFGKVERSQSWVRPWLPDVTTLDPGALLLGIAAAIALLRFHLSVGKTLALSAAVGLAIRWLIA